MRYENIKTSMNDAVGLITLNRPDSLNALSDDLMEELAHALSAFDGNTDIGAIILTGGEKAFAAGAMTSI